MDVDLADISFFSFQDQKKKKKDSHFMSPDLMMLDLLETQYDICC